MTILAGCAGTVVKPVSTSPVPRYLMQSLPDPKCTAPVENDAVPPAALGASNRCWEKAFSTAKVRLSGLQRAVRVREKIIAKAKEVEG